MITGSKEYQEFLASVANSYNPPNVKMRIPTDEPVYEVNLDTRVISTPSFIGVEADHEAELIYFEMDRYFDSVDLANCVGLVQFQNAKHEEYYYVIPYFDTLSKRGKIIFAWDVQSPATKYGGTVQFSFKFFRVNPASGELLYELNTLTAKTRVLVGWANVNGANHTYNQLNAEDILLNNDALLRLQSIVNAEKQLSIFWIDA